MNFGRKLEIVREPSSCKFTYINLNNILFQITNIISIPMNPMTKNHGKIMGLDLLTFVMFGFLYPLLAMS